MLKKTKFKKVISIVMVFAIILTQMVLGIPLQVQASEMLIDFETGYTAGQALSGQPAVGTKWTGNTSLFKVETEGSGKAILSTTATGISNSQNVAYTPSLTDLGIPVDSTLSQVAFSFDISYKSVDPAATNSAWSIYPIRDKSAAAPNTQQGYAWSLDIKPSGEILYQGSRRVKNASGETLVMAAGQWHTISGVADYAAKTCTLQVDGVEQANVTFASGTPDDFGSFYIYNQADYYKAQICIDNIKLRASASSVVSDTTRPTLSSAATNAAGNEIGLVFSEALDTGALSAGSFSIGGTTATVSGAVYDKSDAANKTVKLLLNGAIAAGESVTISLTEGAVKDTALNGILGVSNFTVDNHAASMEKVGQSIQSAAPTGGYQNITYTPSASELGQSLSALTAGRFDFSFVLNMNDAPDTSTNQVWELVVARDTIAPNTGKAIRINVLRNGALKYLNGATTVSAKRLDNTDFKLVQNQGVLVFGTLDYGTKTYTLNIGGVPQNSGSPIGFNATGVDDLGLIGFYSSAQSDYKAISVDSIRIGVSGGALKTIGFDSDEGYSAGQAINGQPAAAETKWTSNASRVFVVQSGNVQEFLNKSTLQDAINEGHAFSTSIIASANPNPGEYPISARNDFITALQAAIAIRDGAASTQAQVNNAVTVLAAAKQVLIAAMIPFPDKTQLTVYLEEAQSMYAMAIEGTEPGQVAVGTKAALLSSINVALQVKEYPNAKQDTVDTALADLKTAIQLFASKIIQLPRANGLPYFPVYFETNEGYTVGQFVYLQPSTADIVKWSSSAPSMFRVKAGTGKNGTNAIQSNEAFDIAFDNKTLTLEPTLKELGTSTLYATKAQFSLDVRIDFKPVTSGTPVALWNIQPSRDVKGTDSGVPTQLLLYSNGQLKFSNNDAQISALGNDGAAYVFTTGKWVTISGTLNYKAKTYTLFVDGIQQKSSTGDLNIPIKNNQYNATQRPDEFGFFAVQLQAKNATDYKQISIDNFDIRVVEDKTAPAPIRDLTVTEVTTNKVSLSWSATGDDETVGRAAAYDVRYSTEEITESNFLSAVQAATVPLPLDSGASQSITLSGLSTSTKYYFAIKAADKVPQVSALSNVATASTLSPEDLKVTKVELTPKNVYVKPGSSVTLAVTVVDQFDGSLEGKAVTWSSSDSALATVENGVVTAGVTEGSVVITAACEGVSQTSNVFVSSKEAPKLAVWNPEGGNVTGESRFKLDLAFKDRVVRWLQDAGMNVTQLSYVQINNPEIFSADKFDAIVYANSGAFPYDNITSLLAFADAGGVILGLDTAMVPFHIGLAPENGGWHYYRKTPSFAWETNALKNELGVMYTYNPSLQDLGLKQEPSDLLKAYLPEANTVSKKFTDRWVYPYGGGIFYPLIRSVRGDGKDTTPMMYAVKKGNRTSIFANSGIFTNNADTSLWTLSEKTVVAMAMLAVDLRNGRTVLTDDMKINLADTPPEPLRQRLAVGDVEPEDAAPIKRWGEFNGSSIEFGEPLTAGSVLELDKDAQASAVSRYLEPGATVKLSIPALGEGERYLRIRGAYGETGAGLKAELHGSQLLMNELFIHNNTDLTKTNQYTLKPVEFMRNMYIQPGEWSVQDSILTLTNPGTKPVYFDAIQIEYRTKASPDMIIGLGNAQTNTYPATAGTANIPLELSKDWGVVRTSARTQYVKAPGSLNRFDDVYKIIDEAIKVNPKVQVILEGTPDWAAISSQRLAESYASGRASACAPDPEKYSEIVQHLAEKYKDNVLFWEVWNEADSDKYYRGSDEEYLELLVKVSQTIKSVNPNARVITTGMAGYKEEFINLLIKNNFMQYADLFSFHPYSGYFPSWDIAHGMVEGNLISNGVNKEIYHDEMGFTWFPDDIFAADSTCTPEVQRDRTDTATARLMSNGVTKLAIFNAGGDKHSFGLIDINGKPRLAYAVFEDYVKLEQKEGVRLDASMAAADRSAINGIYLAAAQHNDNGITIVANDVNSSAATNVNLRIPLKGVPKGQLLLTAQATPRGGIKKQITVTGTVESKDNTAWVNLSLSVEGRTVISIAPFETMVVDVVKPVLVSSSTNSLGNEISLEFSETVNGHPLEAASFTLGGTSSTVKTAEYIGNNEVRLTLNDAVKYGQSVTVSIAAGSIKDAAMNSIDAVNGFQTVNRVPGSNSLSIPAAVTASAEVEAVVLQWSQVQEAQGYRIRYGTAVGVYTEEIVLGNETSCRISGLKGEVAYYFVISAFNDTLKSADSEEVSMSPIKQKDTNISSIVGVVRDGIGPVSGAYVSVTVNGSVHSATTAVDGSYSIDNVPVGTGYIVTADKAGYNAGNASGVNVVANEITSNVNITLTVIPPVVSTGTISGIVTVGAGPVPGANVSVTVNGSVYSATTAADGSYSIGNVPVGTGYSVTADKAGYNSGNASGVSVVGDEITSNVNITLTVTRSDRISTSPTTSPNIKVVVLGTGTSETSLEVSVNTGESHAVVDLKTLQGDIFKGNERIVITVPAIPGVKSYTMDIPADSLQSSKAEGTLTFSTETGSISIPGDMLAGLSETAGKKVGITISQGDKSNLPKEILTSIGNRPLVELSLMLDGKQVAWSNPDAPVTVSLPYTPTASELLNPEHIVIWYIDGSAVPVPVPNGRYDAKTGMVTFTTTHFSYYAIAYVNKTFDDLGNVEWARNPIEVMASKGIINGTGSNFYSPAANITRSDYLVLLVKTLGIAADFDNNFDDVQKGTYYYEAVGIAKKLGLTTGVGNNKFNPMENISRQDMMVLTARALEKFKGCKVLDEISGLDKFSDKGEIVRYAIKSLATLVKEGLISGSGNKLNPGAQTTRAEAAVFLYRIYNK
ncbi:MAG: S-layer homology domain-containing protein [Chitinophagaceae bacterium]|nr:S-layer homology domain-containing protein [Chitinophagaceae bacterium]